jgi:hypothetical protein
VEEEEEEEYNDIFKLYGSYIGDFLATFYKKVL